MRIQPALPTQSTGKVKTHLQTHLRVSTVCLQDTHPKKPNPLPQEISELSTAPISAGLMEFLNIARAKPYFPFFIFTASSAAWLFLLQICWEIIRNISQRCRRTLCSFLSKGSPGSSGVGAASAAPAHRLQRNLPLGSLQLQTGCSSQKNQEKGKSSSSEAKQEHCPWGMWALTCSWCI